MTGTVVHKRNAVSAMWARTLMKRNVFSENAPRPDSFGIVRAIAMISPRISP